jgi:hypothetical protein
MLDAFDEGWENIGEKGRRAWLNRVKAHNDDVSRYPRQFRPYIFTSWSAALGDICRDLVSPQPYSRIDKTSQLRESVESSLSQSNAAIFNLPPMPDAETERSHRESLRRVRFAVGSHVAVKITEVEMTKVFERIQNRLAEPGGLQSILEEYTPDLTWLKEVVSEGQIQIAEGSESVDL